MIEDIVTTIDLPWGESLDKLPDFMASYEVTVEVLPEVGTSYAVKLHGERGKVRHCLSQQWCSNSAPDTPEHEDEINMYLGDSLATHRFNTGCEVGRAHNNFEKINTELLNWDHHWKMTERRTGFATGDQNENAIDFLAEAGYEPDPDNEDDPVEIAQTYLELAFMHCPELPETLARWKQRHARLQPVIASEPVLALSDCLYYERNVRGDCGGRVEWVNGEPVCETCRNRPAPLPFDEVELVVNENGTHFFTTEELAEELMGRVLGHDVVVKIKLKN